MIEIKIDVRHLYGRAIARPFNEPAQLLAEIAGTTTLTLRALLAAEKLGMKVTDIRNYDWRRELAGGA